MREPNINVVIVETSRIPCTAVRDVLADDATIRIVGSADEATAAISLVRQWQPDVVILGVDASPDKALGLCRRINALQLGTKVLVLTSHDDDPTLTSFVTMGVHGYLPRSSAPDELRRDVRAVAVGMLIFPSGVARRVRALFMRDGRLASRFRRPSLTGRETQVLEQMSLGLRNQEIATDLGISEKTVETHVRHLLMKLGVKSRTQAVVQVRRSNWTTSEPGSSETGFGELGPLRRLAE